jgi:pimeloyl-ACP methyl ester carboxylesterase
MAAAIGDFLDSMRFRQIDVLGYQHGSLIAAELAVARPQQVRRVVFVGLPPTMEGERLRQIGQPVLVIRPKDDLWESTPRVREFLPRARALDLPQNGANLFETTAEAAVGPIREFLAG